MVQIIEIKAIKEKDKTDNECTETNWKQPLLFYNDENPKLLRKR